MQRCCFVLLFVGLLWPTQARAQDAFTRITPAEAGYSAEALAELRGVLEANGSESLLLLHNGQVFFEYGDIRQKRLVHSIRKALLHSLVGIENARGDCLSLSRTLADFGVDDIPPPLTDAEKQATLAHVLQSRSGVFHPAAAETDGMAAQRPARGSHVPGTHWYYNNWDFNVAGALYEQCSGERIHDAFLRRIARPLGMRDYQARVDEWPARRVSGTGPRHGPPREHGARVHVRRTGVAPGHPRRAPRAFAAAVTGAT